MNSRSRANIDKDWLYDQYVNKKLSVKSIVKISKYGKKAIRARLGDLNIPIRLHNESLCKKYANQKLGKLTIIRKCGNSLWFCKCDCGNEVTITNKQLNRRRSCGCMSGRQSGEKNPKYTGYKGLTGSKISSIRSHAKRRNIEYDIKILNPIFLYNLIQEQEFKCAITDVEISLASNTASLDRIDSKIGYVKGNVQWVHKDINKMKWDFDQKYFIELCGKVYNFKGNGV